jgi:Tol biopolymer transport system component
LIVFSSDRPAHKQWDLYVMDADGSHLRRITHDRLSEHDPVFLSNRTVAFTAPGGEYVVSINGGERKRLTPILPTWPPSGISPSPNGRWLALALGADLWLERSDGSGLRRLAALAAEIDDLQWSPDGRTLAFNQRSECYLLRIPNGKPHRVSQEEPCITWVGREIAVSQDPPLSGPNGVTLTSPDKSRVLTTLASLKKLNVIWLTSIQSSHKFFVGTYNGQYNNDVYVVNRDGSDLRRVLTIYYDDLALSPDGTKAAVGEPGGPLFYPLSNVPGSPRYHRIDLLDLNSGQMHPVTQ